MKIDESIARLKKLELLIENGYPKFHIGLVLQNYYVESCKIYTLKDLTLKSQFVTKLSTKLSTIVPTQSIKRCYMNYYEFYGTISLEDLCKYGL